MSGNADKGLPLSTRIQCPYAEDCPCTIRTRHEWYQGYIRVVDMCEQQRTEIATLKHALAKAVGTARPRAVKG